VLSQLPKQSLHKQLAHKLLPDTASHSIPACELVIQRIVFQRVCYSSWCGVLQQDKLINLVHIVPYLPGWCPWSDGTGSSGGNELLAWRRLLRAALVGNKRRVPSWQECSLQFHRVALLQHTAAQGLQRLQTVSKYISILTPYGTNEIQSVWNVPA
jgi:hypothetical protein